MAEERASCPPEEVESEEEGPSHSKAYITHRVCLEDPQRGMTHVQTEARILVSSLSSKFTTS